MLTRLANLGIRAPRRVLIAAGVLFVLAAIYGVSAAQHLSAGGFRDPNASSSQAEDLLQSRFRAGDSNLIVEVTSAAGAGNPDVRARGLAVVKAVQASPYASQVQSYWTAPREQASALVSKDGTSALVIARIAGNDSDAPKRAAQLSDGLVGTDDGITVIAGGLANAYKQVNDQTKDDLAIAEAIAIPITMVVLIWVFGSFIAALLPLAVGLTSIIGTMAILRGLASLTDVSIYALNMTTAMGLALAIDYSLFVVSRYREEIRNGAAPDDAVRTTMRTAGRTVLFSALTVGLSLAAMLVFPVYFLRSFAYAGIAVVALATIAALVLLPALLNDSRQPGGRARSAGVRPAAVPPAGADREAGRAGLLVPLRIGGHAARAAGRRCSSPRCSSGSVCRSCTRSSATRTTACCRTPRRRTRSATTCATTSRPTPRRRSRSSRRTSPPPRTPSAGTPPRCRGWTASRSVASAAGVFHDGQRVAAPSGPAMTADGATYLTAHTSLDPRIGRGEDIAV